MRLPVGIRIRIALVLMGIVLLRSEPIARAANRQDQLRIARVPLDLLPKMAYVDVDRPRLTVVGSPAKPLQELAS